MKSLIQLFSCVLLLVLPMNAMAQKPRPQYENIYEIPRFIIFDDETSKVDFMKQISASLQTRLVAGPRNVSFLDSDNAVTKASLDKYIKLETKQFARSQKRALVALDRDGDRAVSFNEYIQQGGYDADDMVRLRDIIREHGVDAIDEIQPILDKMELVENKKITPLTFYTETIPTFIELDLDGDNVLSYKEMKTPSKTDVNEKTRRTVSQFQAYLSLSEDGQKTTLEQINQASEKAFNTLDVNENERLDNSEVSLYLRARLPKYECHMIPNLNDEDAYLYVIGLSSSNVAAPVDFSGEPEYSMTGYVDVEIKKQLKPINLLVGLDEKAIWNFKGDVDSINNLVVFGIGPSRKFPSDFLDVSKVHAGVIGVPDEKITFVNRRECWNFRIPHENANKVRNEEAFQNARGLTRYLTGRYPHLLKLQMKASKIVIGQQPQITFFDETNESYKKAPEGYNRDLWDAFLQHKSAGLAKPDLSQMVSGLQHYKDNIVPSWAGIAQLDYEGIAELVYSDIENRKAVMVLKEDLPFFPNVMHPNPPIMTFVLDNSKLSYPDPKHAQGAFNICVMTAKGEVLLGNRNCSPSDLIYVKADDNKPEALDNPVFVELPKFIPALPSYKESVDIFFNLDMSRCKKQYGEMYQKKCLLSIDEQDNIPPYALNIFPPVEGRLSWRGNRTLTFTPETQWEAGGLYSMTINLDHLGFPKGVYLNGEREAKIQFYASKPFVTVSNVKIADDPTFVTEKRVTADLVSNYPLDDLRISVFHVPETAKTPDDHIYNSYEAYKLLQVEHENSNPLGVFEMPELEKELKITVKNDDKGVEPTYLYVGQPAIGGTMNFVYPEWIAFQDTDLASMSESLKAIYMRAKKGEVEAQRQLGRSYFEGENVSKSLKKARKWLSAAADHGDLEAYVLLGNLYLSRHALEYVESEKAFIAYSTAAHKGSKEAQYHLGKMHGVERYGYYDVDEMMYWLQRSADQDYSLAINQLGTIYETGIENFIEVGYRKALEYYKASAALNDPAGLAHLGHMYLVGKAVKKDREKGYGLALKALSIVPRSENKNLLLAADIVAKSLLAEFSADVEHEERIKLISDKVFDDIEKNYARMWVAYQIANSWDGDRRVFDIVSEILNREAKKTPSLPELKYVSVENNLNMNLKDLFYDVLYDLHYPQAREKAIADIEALLGNDFFNLKVVQKLAYLYAADLQEEKLGKFLERMRVEEYITLDELERSYRYYRMVKADRKIMEAGFNDPNTRLQLSYIEKKQQRDVPEENKAFLKKLDENPDDVLLNSEYAAFLLYRMDDYEGAIKYGEKALSITEFSSAKSITGMAYLIKASQLFKDQDKVQEAVSYLKKAYALGVDTYLANNSCGSFCHDTKRMLKAYAKYKQEDPI